MGSLLSSSSVLLSTLACLGLVVISDQIKRRKTKSKFPLPPGPKGKPIIGNLFDFPADKQWLAATEWKEAFGDIVHLDIVGNHIVILNKFEDAVNLFEKRSNIYSERAVSEMAKLINFDNYVVVTPYGDKWRLMRRILAQEYNKQGAADKVALQEKHAHIFMQNLLIAPESFFNHANSYSGGVSLETLYGFQIQPRDDPHVTLMETAMVGVLKALNPGAFLVDIFPFMRHIPEWLPGASFMKKANQWDRLLHEASETLYNATTDDKPSLVNNQRQKLTSDMDGEESRGIMDPVRHAACAAVLAGLETTSAALIGVMYAILSNPKVQRKGQEELDRVVGRNRLPQHSDIKNLPYVSAIVKESLRLYPNAPIGFPHSVLSEDVYNGLRIPKGTTLLPNVWAISRDKDVYGSDAGSFRPERFFELNVRNPSEFVFGFGRRICPGRYFAENSLLIACACILHGFNITKALNEDGSEISFEPVWKTDIAVHLDRFPCSIKPRFPEVEVLINTHVQN